MLARIAHELYWIGRYVARADDTARMLDGLFQGEPAIAGRPGRRGAALGVGDDGARRRARPRERAGAGDRGGPQPDARLGEPGVGDGVRRARSRGDEAGARRRLARDVAGAQHALPRARHERPRLGARDRAVLGLRVRARALRAVVGARRRDDAARPGVCVPRRRPPRRGREHDAADAPRLDRPRPVRRRGRAGAQRRAAGAAAGDRRARGVPALGRRPRRRLPGRDLPALRAELPALGRRRRRAAPRSPARRRPQLPHRPSPAASRAPSRRARVPPSRRRRATRRRSRGCSSTCSRSWSRPTAKSSSATSAAPSPRRRW